MLTYQTYEIVSTTGPERERPRSPVVHSGYDRENGSIYFRFPAEREDAMATIMSYIVIARYLLECRE